MNVAIILAGGSGERMGATLPKQFLKVAGKMVIEHTIDAFQSHPLIDEIAVVSGPNYISEIERICVKNSFCKLKKILCGGTERYQSSLAAINAYLGMKDVNLIFHDAVRPLVNHRIIDDVISALKEYNAVDVAINSTDTIIQSSQHNTITGIPNRNFLRNGQTPQAFKLYTIKKAYDLALEDPHFQTTDDCGVVHKYLLDEPIYIVKGEVFNMKLTYKEDLFLLDKLFQLKSIELNNDKLIDQNIKVLENKVLVVFGGSYGIGSDIVKLGQELGVKVYSFSRSENHVDVSDIISVRNALADVYSKTKRIDYVISTAGILQKEPLKNMSYEDILLGVNVNYIGAIIVAKESFAYLKESKGGLLLFTSSSYTRGRSMYSLYSSSKAAIVNFVQAISEEWNEFGIRVNCINPERTKTPMRIKNFGNEPESTLLNPVKVAITALNSIASKMNGEVIDIKHK